MRGVTRLTVELIVSLTLIDELRGAATLTVEVIGSLTLIDELRGALTLIEGLRGALTLTDELTETFGTEVKWEVVLQTKLTLSSSS